jgi:hypothetical protein
MITKTRNTPSVPLAGETWSSDGYFYTGTPGSPISPINLSYTGASVPSGTVDDEVITYANSGKRRWNPCSHVRSVFRMLDPRVKLKIYPNSLYARTWNSYPLHQAGQHTTGSRLAAAFAAGRKTYNQDDLDTVAVSSVWPEIEQVVDESVANFAIDVPKLANLKSSGARFLSTWKQVTKAVRASGPKRFSNLPLRQVLRVLSEGTLIKQYVVQTTYRDIRDLCHGLSTARRQLESLKGNSGKVLRKRYRRVLEPENVEGSGTNPAAHWWALPTSSPLQGNGAYYSYCYNKYLRARHNLHISYSYELPGVNETLLRLQALLDMLGLNLNPRILWDATRYSFVVDWVLRVGDFLEQFKVPWIRPVVKVHSCWSTLHVFQRVECRAWKSKASNYNDPTSAVAPVPVGYAEHEVFVRRRATKGFLGLKTSGLSRYEFTMLSALFGARR